MSEMISPLSLEEAERLSTYELLLNKHIITAPNINNGLPETRYNKPVGTILGDKFDDYFRLTTKKQGLDLKSSSQ